LRIIIDSLFDKEKIRFKSILPVYGRIKADKMTKLIEELRHQSILGHGFKGISKETIEKIYKINDLKQDLEFIINYKL